MKEALENIKSEIEVSNLVRKFGKIVAIKGMMMESVGLSEYLTVGSRVVIYKDFFQVREPQEDKRDIISHDQIQDRIFAEVVAFEKGNAILMPFSDIIGIGIGAIVELYTTDNVIYPDESWLGRVLNAFGEPVDDKALILKKGQNPYHLKTSPPAAHKRNRVGKKIDLGVRAIDSFLSCCYGQRMGIFAGSGVGKSVLISMLTKYADVDVKIIGLVGERGREVQEFIHEYLGEEGLKSAIIVVATGDEAALMRKQAAYMTITLAEYFRDLGKEVLCIIDSITRFAMAQREIGLSVGEPPSSKGYTPTVFSELPRLLERAGPGVGVGNITGLFTVLVEGDDTNEIISDSVRGVLDGHIILDRAIAERGRFPAINILKSVSRMIPKCNNDWENHLIRYGRKILATYEDMAEMIRIGAYQKGSNLEVDMAIGFYPQLESFLAQNPDDRTSMADSYKLLAQILNIQPINAE